MGNLCKIERFIMTSSNLFSFSFPGLINLSSEKVTVDSHHPLSSYDSSISLETTYIIPATEASAFKSDNDISNNNRIKIFIQHPSITVNGRLIAKNISESNQMTQRKSLSFVDAVNGKHLDLSTGLFSSSPLPFVLSSTSSSSSPFSSSTSPLDQHRHPHNHFSSSPPPHTTTTSTADNKNRLFTSSLSVNNHPPPVVGTDSTISTSNTSPSISLKEAINANIIDGQSAYVVDTLEQR